jgi:hypothetical protein
MDLIIAHMVLVQKREIGVFVNALVMTHVFLIMVFISHVDMTFSWMTLPLLELSCFDGPHFSCCGTCPVSLSCCGWQVVCACDR